MQLYSEVDLENDIVKVIKQLGVVGKFGIITPSLDSNKWLTKVITPYGEGYVFVARFMNLNISFLKHLSGKYFFHLWPSLDYCESLENHIVKNFLIKNIDLIKDNRYIYCDEFLDSLSYMDN